MSSLSIRGVDELLSASLKQQAHRANKSVNQFVIETLKKRLGLEKEKIFTKEYDDLDHLFGSWSKKEFLAIQGEIDQERQIDYELWNE